MARRYATRKSFILNLFCAPNDLKKTDSGKEQNQLLKLSCEAWMCPFNCLGGNFSNTSFHKSKVLNEHS